MAAGAGAGVCADSCSLSSSIRIFVEGVAEEDMLVVAVGIGGTAAAVAAVVMLGVDMDREKTLWTNFLEMPWRCVDDRGVSVVVAGETVWSYGIASKSSVAGDKLLSCKWRRKLALATTGAGRGGKSGMALCMVWWRGELGVETDLRRMTLSVD